MSRTDHHGAHYWTPQTRETRPRWMIALPSLRHEIAEQLSDDSPVRAAKPARRTLETIQLPGFDALERERTNRLSDRLAAKAAQSAFQWREAAMSNCEFGCKVYVRVNMGVREFQVQHSAIYGCRRKNADETVMAEWEADLLGYVNQYTPYREIAAMVAADVAEFARPATPKIQHHVPVDRPMRPTTRPHEGSIPLVGANQGKHHANLDVETPSIHQMAQRRARLLGLAR